MNQTNEEKSILSENLFSIFRSFKSIFSPVFSCVENGGEFCKIGKNDVAKVQYLMNQFRGVLKSYNSNATVNLENFFYLLSEKQKVDKRLRGYNFILSKIDLTEKFVKQFLHRIQIEGNSLLRSFSEKLEGSELSHYQTKETYCLQNIHTFVEVDVSQKKISVKCLSSNSSSKVLNDQREKDLISITHSFFSQTEEGVERSLKLITEMIIQDILLPKYPDHGSFLKFDKSMRDSRIGRVVLEYKNQLCYTIKFREQFILSLWFLRELLKTQNRKLSNKFNGENFLRIVIGKQKRINNDDDYVDESKVYSYHEHDNTSFTFFAKVKESSALNGIAMEEFSLIKKNTFSSILLQLQRQKILNILIQSCFKTYTNCSLTEKNKIISKEKMKIEVCVDAPFLLYLIVFFDSSLEMVNIKISITKELKFHIGIDKKNVLTDEHIENSKIILEKTKNVPLFLYYLCKKLKVQ